MPAGAHQGSAGGSSQSRGPSPTRQALTKNKVTGIRCKNVWPVDMILNDLGIDQVNEDWQRVSKVQDFRFFGGQNVDPRLGNQCRLYEPLRCSVTMRNKETKNS